MRSFVVAAVAAVALASSASAQTCSTANLAFITSPSGPFVSECAQVVTANTLQPYGVATTQLLDPAQSTAAFLLSTTIITKMNTLLDKLAPAITAGPPAYPGGIKANRTDAGWPAYPFGANPLVSNFSNAALWLVPAYGQAVNQTVSGAAAYVLCPVLKQVVRDLLQCVPKNCSSLVGGLCASPSAATAASLMGTYANTPFVTGTLAVFAAINQLCPAAIATKALNPLAAVFPLAGINEGNFNSTCSDIAPASAIGTFTYSSTNSPTQSAAAEVGMGAVAAVATLAAAAFAF